MDEGKGQLSWQNTKRDLFLKLDGVTIAKRGRPGSRHAGKWVSLKTGYQILDDPETGEILIGIDKGFREGLAHLSFPLAKK
jgi:hypothetical protein